MVKSRKSNQRFKKNKKYKTDIVAARHRYAQLNLVKMEKRLLPFVKKDENGKIVGFELPQDDTSLSPACPLCKYPLELKKPKARQSWKPFWGCTQFRITGCTGSDKDIVYKQPKEPVEVTPEDEKLQIKKLANPPQMESQHQIVKLNKQGKLIVNRNIQAESNGALSWGDVVDLIDEALDDGEYQEDILAQLNAYRENILIDKQVEQGLSVARRAPKSPVKPKEEPKEFTKPTGHTYFLTQQFREAKEKKKAAKAAKAAKLAEDNKNGLTPSKQNPVKKKKKKEKKFLITPMSYAKSGGPQCPLCKAPMTKKEPQVGQDWKPFWGCVEFPRCKGTKRV